MVVQAELRFLIAAIGVMTMLIITAGNGCAQLIIDADRQYQYAQARFDAGAFDEAIAEFNRFIHFFPTDPRIRQARFRIGMALFNAGRYPAAATVFDSLTASATDLSVDDNVFIMLSRSHARQGLLDQAMVDLHNLMALSSQPKVIDRALYELGWLYVDQGRWNLADQTFDRIGPDGRQRLGIHDLRQKLSRSEAIPVKSPTTAGLLSIIPGAGQLYCGRYQDAATAFVINAGLIWAAWEAFDDGQYALGGVISFVEFGFYAGNIYGAASSAHKHNRNQAAAFREDLYRHRQTLISLAPVSNGAALILSLDF